MNTTTKLPALTAENYYSAEMNMAYMSASQYKDFEKCEAAALAELRGEYTPASSTALLVGGFIDAYFSGESALYQAQHPEIFKRDGQLKAEYVHAQDVINRMLEDRLYTLLMSGRKQVIKTGFIAGVPFKIKIDSLLDREECEAIVKEFPGTAAALGFGDGAIVDQKAMKDFSDVWSDTEYRRVPFWEYYGYDIQGAIYQEIDGRSLPFGGDRRPAAFLVHGDGTVQLLCGLYQKTGRPGVNAQLILDHIGKLLHMSAPYRISF